MTKKFETLVNGATVLEQRGNIVLCSWRGEFVTWEVNDSGDAYWGHYHRTVTAAAEEFNERCAKRGVAA
jgi:hypothetical protein